MQCEKQNNSYVGLLLGWISYTVLGPKVIMLGEVDQLEFFFKNSKLWFPGSQMAQKEWLWVTCWSYQTCHGHAKFGVISLLADSWSKFLINVEIDLWLTKWKLWICSSICRQVNCAQMPLKGQKLWKLWKVFADVGIFDAIFPISSPFWYLSIINICACRVGPKLPSHSSLLVFILLLA